MSRRLPGAFFPRRTVFATCTRRLSSPARDLVGALLLVLGGGPRLVGEHGPAVDDVLDAHHGVPCEGSNVAEVALEEFALHTYEAADEEPALRRAEEGRRQLLRKVQILPLVSGLGPDCTVLLGRAAALGLGGCRGLSAVLFRLGGTIVYYYSFSLRATAFFAPFLNSPRALFALCAAI